MRKERHNKKKSSQDKLTLARLNTAELWWAKGGYQDATAEEESEFDEEEEGEES